MNDRILTVLTLFSADEYSDQFTRECQPYPDPSLKKERTYYLALGLIDSCSRDNFLDLVNYLRIHLYEDTQVARLFSEWYPRVLPDLDLPQRYAICDLWSSIGLNCHSSTGPESTRHQSALTTTLESFIDIVLDDNAPTKVKAKAFAAIGCVNWPSSKKQYLNQNLSKAAVEIITQIRPEPLKNMPVHKLASYSTSQSKAWSEALGLFSDVDFKDFIRQLDDEINIFTSACCARVASIMFPMMLHRLPLSKLEDWQSNPTDYLGGRIIKVSKEIGAERLLALLYSNADEFLTFEHVNEFIPLYSAHSVYDMKNYLSVMYKSSKDFTNH